MAALGRCPLFSGWSEAILAQLAAFTRVASYPRGTEIFSRDPQQRDVLVIASGGIEISRVSASGRRFLLSLQGPHEILAIVRLLSALPIHYAYRAYEDSVLLHIPCDALSRLLDQVPILWRDVALLMCARQGESLRLLNDQALATPEQRLARVLSDLMRLHGIEQGDRMVLGLRLPQEQLAAMLGVARQSVNKLLRNLQDRGIVEIDYNRITVLDPAAIARIACDAG